jgi:hypothetical protein
MGKKRHKPEEIVAKLRQVDVLLSQGESVAEAIRSIGVRDESMFNQPINRIFDDGTQVAMESRVFRFSRLLSDRLQAVAFAKADA